MIYHKTIKIVVSVNKAPYKRYRTYVLKGECMFAKMIKKEHMFSWIKKEQMFSFEPNHADHIRENRCLEYFRHEHMCVIGGISERTMVYIIPTVSKVFPRRFWYLTALIVAISRLT